MSFHSKEKEEVIADHKSSAEKGLSQAEAESRLEQHGPNTLVVSKPKSPVLLFFSQFKNFLVLVLILAALVSFFIGFLPGQELEYENAILILIIVLLNGVFGFAQDYKAEKSIDALKKISVSKAKVIRDGKVHLVAAEALVPGDIVMLEAGEKIPADLRIIESDDMTVDESLLTGESLPSKKHSRTLNKHTQLADRANMGFMNTIVTNGSGKGLVVGTGQGTEVGKIAAELFSAPQKKSLFTKELDKLGKHLGWVIIALILITALTQLCLGSLDPFVVFMVAVSLGVAAIPEGLPAVVTLSMALGTRKMLKQRALVRKLSVVESLGSVDMICTDKTGTLTENRMTVRQIYFEGTDYEVEGRGYDLKGKFFQNGKLKNPKSLLPLLTAGLNCNNAMPGVDEKGEDTYLGDPTEIALLISAKKAGLKGPYKRIHEIPFSSESKLMVTVHKINGRNVAYIKGAPEIVLKRATKLYYKGKAMRLNEKQKYGILGKNDEMAKKALRVLGFALKPLPQKYKDSDLTTGFTFLGLQGMIDPPRKGVKAALKVCSQAGIGVKMVTGDNMLTALAISREIGLGHRAMNGAELDKLTQGELRAKVENIDIFARVTPSHKVRVLEALQANGHLVAMTGDGVNDAPALKHADVSVGMALRGSDLAKESSEMILLDDNFVTIKNAIREGRTIFNNIRKFVNYLLTSNIAEVLVVFIVSLFGWLPILPVQLLWINLLTDGLPALALGIDPPLKHIMRSKPKQEGIINKQMLALIIGIGLIITTLVVPLFFIGLTKGLIVAQTMVFTALVVYELLRILVIRAQEHLNLFSNKWLLFAILTSIGLQLVVVYTPLSRFFGTAPLGAFEWWLIVGLGALGYIFSLLIAQLVAIRVRQ